MISGLPHNHQELNKKRALQDITNNCFKTVDNTGNKKMKI